MTLTITTTYDMVKSGQWTFEQFAEWVESCRQDSFNDGYSDGYSNGYADANNDSSGE